MPKTEVAAIFIQNSKGDFFVHQRLASKKKFPNKYGIGAGGHVDEGEKPEEAASRELLEETGLKTPIRYLFTEDFDTPEFQQISHAYITQSDDSIHTDETEWQSSGWMTKQQVDDLLAKGELCTDTAVIYRRFITGISN